MGVLNVAAVTVTRGDVDLDPVLDSLPANWERVVWVNGQGCHSWRPPGWKCSRDGYEYELSEGGETHDLGRLDPVTGVVSFPDLSVYGRYEAIKHSTADLIYVQDDDCILAPESFDALLDAYQPGHIVANMPERFRPHYPDSCLVGFGAIFDRDLPDRAFDLFHERDATGIENRHFLRTADVVFSTLTPRILLDLPYADREFASAPGRMWTSEGHIEERTRMLELARAVRDAVLA